MILYQTQGVMLHQCSCLETHILEEFSTSGYRSKLVQSLGLCTMIVFAMLNRIHLALLLLGTKYIAARSKRMLGVGDHMIMDLIYLL